MLKIQTKIIPTVHALERLICEFIERTLQNQVSPGHRLRITVSVRLGFFFLLPFYSSKDVSAYPTEVHTLHNVLLSTANF